MTQWDPRTYLQFADERARPFFDLVSRVRAEQPTSVIDLGCGPGQLTASLPDRWPSATVVGLDSSPAMIAQAEVIISNAALQWVPGHRELLPRLVEALAPGGWLAFQVPGNFSEPSHRLLQDLAGLGCTVDAWETTYLHRLTGPDPVFGWIRGTGARPVLQALPDGLREQFEIEYNALLAAAYPARPYGTVLPFRRIFVVAQQPADRS